MTYSPVPVESFGGLNLLDDIGTVGWNSALDMLNVELDRRGRLRSRDGFAVFTAATAAGTIHTLAPFYTTGGTKQLIAGFGGSSGAVRAYDTTGTTVASQSFANSTYASVARFAAPGSEHAYVAVSGSGAATVYRWDGTAWSTPTWTGTTPTGRHLAATSDNRLANARRNGTTQGDNPSTVFFSDAGVPTTWGVNNYVDVSPGDGEEIMALVAWGNNLFAFKQTKFAVFYGNSTDASGNPVFNYRLVTSAGLSPSVGGGAAYRAVCTSPSGIYFANRRGIWLTDGGPAQLVSRKVDPIFTGATDASGPSALNQGSIDKCALLWHDQKLWFAYPSGSATTNDRILRYDPVTDAWTLYDLPASAMGSFRAADAEEFMFGLSGSTVTLTPPAGVSASDTAGASSLSGGTTYYYKITALNGMGETTPSSEVNATPSLLGGGFCVALSWAAVPGATGYRVYRGTASDGENVYYAPGNVTTYTDSGAASTGGSPPVSNTATTTGNDIGRHSSSYTLDSGDGSTTGVPITSRYRSGFSDLGSPDRKVVREWLLEGTGSPTFKTSHDFGSLEAGAAVPLGTSPAVLENRRRYAVKGRQFSFEIGGTSAWSVNNVVANIRDKKLPGET